MRENVPNLEVIECVQAVRGNDTVQLIPRSVERLPAESNVRSKGSHVPVCKWESGNSPNHEGSVYDGGVAQSGDARELGASRFAKRACSQVNIALPIPRRHRDERHDLRRTGHAEQEQAGGERSAADSDERQR